MSDPITAIRRTALPEQGLFLVAEWDPVLFEQLPDSSLRPDIAAPVLLELRFSLDGPRVILEGTCRAQCCVVCVRCLERFVHSLSTTFRYVFQPAGPAEASEDVQLSSGDIEVVCYDGEHIDLVAPVCEHIQLGLPTYPRCSAACRGLCVHCGANLNDGMCGCTRDSDGMSPFAVLGSLKKKKCL